MKTKLIIFIVLTAFASCQYEKKEKQIKTEAPSKEDTGRNETSKSDISSKSLSFVDTVDFNSLEVTDTIYDNKFSIAPLNLNTKRREHIPYSDIVSSGFQLDSSFVKSSIDPSKEYEVVRLQTNHSLLIFLRGLGGAIALDRATIFDSSVKLANGIRVGMSKNDFLESFNRESKLGGVLLVKDQDQVYEHLFYFQNDTLVAIKLESVLSY